jgi:hypothetical protein
MDFGGQSQHYSETRSDVYTQFCDRVLCCPRSSSRMVMGLAGSWARVLCLDCFHVPAWAGAEVDAARRGMWNQLRRDGKTPTIGPTAPTCSKSSSTRSSRSRMPKANSCSPADHSGPSDPASPNSWHWLKRPNVPAADPRYPRAQLRSRTGVTRRRSLILGRLA